MSRTLFATAVAVVAATPLEVGIGVVHAKGSQWELLASGFSTLPVPRLFSDRAFVATGPSATRPFRHWLRPSDRRRLHRFDYRNRSILATVIRGVPGSRVLLERVRRDGEVVVVYVAVIPAATRRQRILYRVFALPKTHLGTSPVTRIVMRTRALLRPPPAVLESAAGSFRLALGSGCWNRGDRGVCWDAPPPSPTRSDIPEVPVRPGELLTFRLGFTPLSVDVVLERDAWQERYELLPTRSPDWRTPIDLSGPTYFILTTRSAPDLAGSGGVSYFGRLVRRE